MEEEMSYLNYFEKLVEFQKNMLEEQKKIYDAYSKNFNLDFTKEDFFKNLSNFNLNNNWEDFLGQYSKLSNMYSDAFKENFKNMPDFQKALDSYKANMELLEKVFNSYSDFYKTYDFSKTHKSLLNIYEIFNEELVNLAKENLEKFMPVNLFDVLSNFSLDSFIGPILNISKKNIEYFKTMLDKQPKFALEEIEKFYRETFDKYEDGPIFGITEEQKKENKKNFEKLLDIGLKILDFNIFLNQSSMKASLKVQEEYLKGLDSEEGLEDFSDFFKFYSKKLSDVYSDLIDSKQYQEKSKAIKDLFEENKKIYTDLFEKGLDGFPILTQSKLQNKLNKIDDLNLKIMELENDIKKFEDQINSLKNNSK